MYFEKNNKQIKYKYCFKHTFILKTCRTFCDLVIKWCPLYVQKRFRLDKKPVYVIDYNLVDSTQDRVFRRTLKNYRGVYGWFHKQTAHGYIGAAKNMGLRSFQHIPNSKGVAPKSSQLLQQAIANYGIQNFILVIFELIEDKYTITVKELRSIEQSYLQSVDSTFNIMKLAYIHFGHKHTPETLQKLRILNVRKHTEESKNCIRQALTGVNAVTRPDHWSWGKTMPGNTKRKISDARKGQAAHNKKAGTIKNVITGEIKTFNTMKDLGIFFGVNSSTTKYHLDKQPGNIIYSVWVVEFTSKKSFLCFNNNCNSQIII